MLPHVHTAERVLGANMLGVPTQWIAVAALCLNGVAMVYGVSATRQKDRPP